MRMYTILYVRIHFKRVKMNKEILFILKRTGYKKIHNQMYIKNNNKVIHRINKEIFLSNVKKKFIKRFTHKTFFNYIKNWI